jgi:3-methyladenine DNA glycosylase Tag
MHKLSKNPRRIWKFFAIHLGFCKSHLCLRNLKVPATSPISDAISKDLKKRGFKFVGSTVMYAFMQATGMVNDHVENCWKRNS